MLARRRAEAEAPGGAGDPIEDVLRRVMRESYILESASDKGAPTSSACPPDLGSRGDHRWPGQLGRLFGNPFSLRATGLKPWGRL